MAQIAQQRAPGVRLLTFLVTSLALVSLAGLEQTARVGGAGLTANAQERRPSALAALWQRKLAPGAGTVESLATDPRGKGRALLCQGGVVWLSRDEGRSFAPVFKSDSEQGVTAAFHPTEPATLFLATNRRLLVSADGGKDWTVPEPGLKFKWRPRAILISNEAPNRIYITTRGEGIYRSDDGGHTWSAINSGLPESNGAAPIAPIESAVLDPTDPEVAYAAPETNGVYKTTDGGATWTRASQGLPGLITHGTYPWVLAIDPANPQRLLVWAHWPVHSERVTSAFFLSEDGAVSWRKVAAADQGRVLAIQFVEAKDGLAVAITEDGVMRLAN